MYITSLGLKSVSSGTIVITLVTPCSFKAVISMITLNGPFKLGSIAKSLGP